MFVILLLTSKPGPDDQPHNGTDHDFWVITGFSSDSSGGTSTNSCSMYVLQITFFGLKFYSLCMGGAVSIWCLFGTGTFA